MKLNKSTKLTSHSQTPKHNNLKNLSKKELEFKRKNLIDKISNLLKNKYKSIFKLNNYDMSTLIADLDRILTNEELLSFEYDRFMRTVEAEILGKMKITNANMKLKNLNSPAYSPNIKPLNDDINNLYTTEKVEHYLKNLNSTDESLKLTNTDEMNKQFTTTISNSPYDKKAKLEILKEIKEKDDWALLAKKDYERYLEEKKNKNLNMEKKTKLARQYLDQQILDKTLNTKHKKDDDLDYFHFLEKEQEKWKNNQEAKKIDQIKKVKDFIEMNDKIIKGRVKFNNLKF